MTHDERPLRHTIIASLLLLALHSMLGAQLSHGQNLLRNGSFEGAKKYWLEGGEIDHANPAHGQYSLRIEKRGPRSGSFRLEPGRKVTISLFARSAKPGKVSVTVCPSNRQVAQQTKTVWTRNAPFARSVDIGTEWKRVSWALDIPELEAGGKFLGSSNWWWNKTSWIMMIGGSAKPLWVDGVSVAHDRGTEAYVPRAEVEVFADAPGLTGYKETANLLADGDTVEVRAAAFSNGDGPKTFTLRWELLDYEGDHRLGEPTEKEVRIEPGQTVVETVPVRLTGKGLMLARVSVMDDGGTVIDKSDQPLTALAFPKAATTPNPEERFGGSLRGGPLVAAAQKIGLGWTRWYPHINWASVQRKGADDWQWPDEVVEDLHRHGISINAVLYSIPKWAKGQHSHLPADMEAWGNDDPRWQDLSVETGWDRFVTTAVKRYASRSVVWEFANEPDIGKWDGAVYFNLLRRTHQLIKKANPKATVLVDVTWPGVSGFTMGLLRRGGGKYFDVHTFHNYATGPCAGRDSIRDLQTVFKSFDCPGKGIWFNEGWTYIPTSEDYAAPPIIDKSPPEVAHMIVRTAAELFAAGMHKLITFHIGYGQHGKSWWDWVGSGTEWWDDHGNPTVAVPTYNVLADQLGLSEFVESIHPYGATIHVFQDQRNDRGVAVAWSNDEAKTLELPLTEFVRMDVMGNSIMPKEHGGRIVLHLPADSRPFYLFSQKGLSGKELGDALRPFDQREAERLAQAAGAARFFRVPEEWEGVEAGKPDGSTIEEGGQPLWQVGRLLPADPLKAESYKQLRWSGRRWHAVDVQLGGQPAVTITPTEVQLGARGGWGGGKIPMLPYLKFFAPEAGRYELSGLAKTKVWYGKGPIELWVLKIDAARKVSRIKTVKLDSGEKTVLDGLRASLKKGEAVAILPWFPRRNVAGNVHLSELRVASGGAEGASGETEYRPPERWNGAKVETTDGNPYAVDGESRWRLDQVWPDKPLRTENYHPLTWNGKEWTAKSHSHGGQPAAAVSHQRVKLVGRGPWSGQPGNKLPALSFIVPKDETYQIQGNVSVNIWSGGGTVSLHILRLPGGKPDGSTLKTVSLKKDEKASFGLTDVDLRKGDRVTLVPGFPGFHVAATFEVTNLQIRSGGGNGP